MKKGALCQPLGQKLLTNVAVLRLDRKGQHFEIAVVPNKVNSWRNGLETNIDDVLQSHSIFTNVDQGLLAKTSTVLETLNVHDIEEALKIILKEGKVNLAEKERKMMIENLTKDIASIVASQCINSNTQRPLTASMVERAMKAVGYSVKLKKAPKAQALNVIKLLQAEHYPISRARIRLKLMVQPDIAEKMKEMIPLIESIDTTDPNLTSIIAQIDPGHLRPLAGKLVAEFGSNIAIDILDVNVSSTAARENNSDLNENNEVSDNEEDEEKNEIPENANVSVE